MCNSLRESMQYNDNYVKMCIAATEIQQIWNTTPHHKGQHYIASNGISSYEFVFTNTTNDRLLAKKFTTFWLPTQEEIQEILFSKYQKTTKDYLRKIIKYFKNDSFKSLNEYWLLILMETSYQKKWNGESWISIEKGI